MSVFSYIRNRAIWKIIRRAFKDEWPRRRSGIPDFEYQVTRPVPMPEVDTLRALWDKVDKSGIDKTFTGKFKDVIRAEIRRRIVMGQPKEVGELHDILSEIKLWEKNQK